MITLEQVTDWIEALGIGEHFYFGKLDGNMQKAIGVYNRKEPLPAIIALGGTSNSTYNIKRISILVHWNQSASDTEESAMQLYQNIAQSSNVTIGDSKVYFIRLSQNEPIDLGTDDNGIFEYSIEFDVYYERS